MRLNRVKSIFEILRLSVRFILTNYPGSTISAILFGIASIAIEGASIALIISFLNAYTDQKPMHLPFGWSIDFTKTAIIYLVIIILAMLVASGALSYLSRIFKIKIFDGFRTTCIEQFLSIPGGAIEPRIKYASTKDGANLIRQMVSQTSRRAGMAILSILNGFDSTLRAIVFGLISLYLQPTATALIISIGFVLIFWQYNISRRIHNIDDSFKNSQKGLGRFSAEYTKAAATQSGKGLYSPDNVQGSTVIQDSVNPLGEIMKLRELSDFAGHILYSLGMVAAITIIAVEVSLDAVDITQIILFIYAIRLFLQSTKSLFGLTGALSRHYKYLRDAILFLEFTPTQAPYKINNYTPKTTKTSWQITDRLGNTLEIVTGSTWLIYSPIRLSTYTLNFITYPLLKSQSREERVKHLISFFYYNPAVLTKNLFELTGYNNLQEMELTSRDNELVKSIYELVNDLPWNKKDEIDFMRPINEQLDSTNRTIKILNLINIVKVAESNPDVIFIDHRITNDKSLYINIHNFINRETTIFIVCDAPGMVDIPNVTGSILIDYQGVYEITTSAQLKNKISQFYKKMRVQHAKLLTQSYVIDSDVNDDFE